jgi:hypothetical protein
MPAPKRKMVARTRQVQEYRIWCGGMMLTARHKSGSWIATIDGPDEKYLAIKKNESRAKEACIEVATAILRRRGARL